MPSEDRKADPENPKISLIIPFYNERENLEELHERILRAAPVLDAAAEVIYVDDGSTDGGGGILRKFLVHPGKVRLITLARRRGKSAALYAGFEQARSDIFLTLDADLQNPPEEIPKLLAAMRKGSDFVIGIRVHRQDGRFKKACSKIANGVRRAILRDSIQDTGCGLAAFRKEVLQDVQFFEGIHRFLPVIAQFGGFRVQQVPVRHEPRRHGRSKYGLRNRLVGPFCDMFRVLRMRRKIRYLNSGIKP